MSERTLQIIWNPNSNPIPASPQAPVTTPPPARVANSDDIPAKSAATAHRKLQLLGSCDLKVDSLTKLWSDLSSSFSSKPVLANFRLSNGAQNKVAQGLRDVLQDLKFDEVNRRSNHD